MTISTTIAIAALPALRFATHSLKGAYDSSVGFASQLAGASPEKSSASNSTSIKESKQVEFDQLTPQLQAFLRSLGTDNQVSVELKSDGEKGIEVEGDPSIKERVESWLEQNPDWAAAWKTAAKEYLQKNLGQSALPSTPWSEHSKLPSLRSQINLTRVEHWQSV